MLKSENIPLFSSDRNQIQNRIETLEEIGSIARLVTELTENLEIDPANDDPRDLAVNAIIAHRLFLKTLTLTNRYNDAVTNSEKENGIEYQRP